MRPWSSRNLPRYDGNARLLDRFGSDDGFALAEKDFELRGPGDFIGTRQSGLPEMRWLDGAFDTQLLDRARRAAEEVLARDPALDRPEHERYGRRSEWRKRDDYPVRGAAEPR